MTSPTPSRLARRSRFHPIIRQVHLWIGAWGAIAAIVFGLSGLVLNHRFALELPQGERETSEPVRITVPEPARKDMDAMAAWLAQELLSTFADDLGKVSLEPATGGAFRITCDGVQIWERKADGGFPEAKVLKQRVRDRIDPQRDLGHNDRTQ